MTYQESQFASGGRAYLSKRIYVEDEETAKAVVIKFMGRDKTSSISYDESSKYSSHKGKWTILIMHVFEDIYESTKDEMFSILGRGIANYEKLVMEVTRYIEEITEEG